MHQSKHTKDLLKTYVIKFDGYKEATTPMLSSLKLNNSKNGEELDKNIYIGMNGSLISLQDFVHLASTN